MSWIFNLLFITMVITGCKKEKEQTHYPDCFDKLTATSFTGLESCSNTITFNMSASQTVIISYNDSHIDFKSGCNKYNLADYPFDIIVSYYTYEYSPDSVYFGYCDGVAYPPELYGVKTKWKAVSGTLTAAVSKEKSLREDCEPFKISLCLENIKFIKENSASDTTLNSLVIKDAVMGMCIL